MATYRDLYKAALAERKAKALKAQERKEKRGRPKKVVEVVEADEEE